MGDNKKYDLNKFFENQERQLINNFKQKEDARKIAREPSNQRLKYLACAVISAGMIFMLIMLIWYDSLSYSAVLWLRGLTGVSAIIFVIIGAVLIYRINNKSIQHRYGRHHKKG